MIKTCKNYMSVTDYKDDYENSEIYAVDEENDIPYGDTYAMIDADVDNNIDTYSDTYDVDDENVVDKNAQTSKVYPEIVETPLTAIHNIYPIMSKDELLTCIAKYQKTGDRKCRDRVVYSNINLIHSIIRRYHFDTMIYNNASVDYDDLVQVGVMGMITAIERFDCTKNVTFSTYVYYWVRQRIYRYITSVGNVTTPVHMRSLLNRIIYIKTLLSDAGIAPTIQAISDETGITCEFLRELANYDPQTVSLDAPISADVNKSTAIGEFIADNTNIEDDATKGMLLQAVEQYISKQPEKTRDILYMRLGLGVYNREYTLQEIADKHDLTRERVRQITLRHLRLMHNDKAILAAAGKSADCVFTGRFVDTAYKPRNYAYMEI